MPRREEASLAGPVRSVRTDVTRFAREAGKVTQKPWYHSAVEYDAAGRATEQATRNPNGTITRTRYIYDGAGRLAETRSELDGVSAGRTVYLYDRAGRLSCELSLRADGSEGRQTRRFYEPDGSSTEEFTVDQEQPETAPAGGGSAPAERASFIRTRRDAADRPLEIRFYDAGGSMLHRFVYHYNAAGLLTDMEQRTGDAPPFSPDIALSTVRYRYDEQGRRIEAATWMGAHCIERRAFAYDERGDKVREERYGLDGARQPDIIYQRGYDDQGNWVSETRLEGGVPAGVTRRTIEYFQA